MIRITIGSIFQYLSGHSFIFHHALFQLFINILSTGINIWEYEGGYSYHGKSILIDDDLSVIGSFNMDMRSTYLDTELMLVIRSKEINKQLEEGMMEYERVSRQVLEDGTYRDPYHVEPIELTKKRQRNVLLVQHLLGWARYLF